MKRLNIIFMLLFIFLIPVTVFAKDSLVVAGEDVSLDGEYDTTKIVAGDKVTNEAKVDGILFLFGDVVKNNGDLEYVVGAGDDVEINGKVNKDLFVVGDKVKITKDAEIKRDLFIAGDSVKIDTNNARNVYIAADSIDVSGITIDGNLYVACSNITMNSDTVINGTFKYNEDATVVGLNDDNVNDIQKYDGNFKMDKDVKKPSFSLFSVVSSLLTMTIILLFCKKYRDVNYGKNKEDNAVAIVAKNLVAGVCCMTLTIIAFVLLLCTIVGIPISLILLVLFIIACYLSTSVASYELGKVVMNAAIKEKNSWIISLSVGILAFNLLCMIPYLDSFVGSIAFLYGLGYITNEILKVAKNK